METTSESCCPRGRAGVRREHGPRVEQTWQMAETAERAGYVFRVGRRQHNFQAAHGTLDGHGRRRCPHQPGQDWHRRPAQTPCAIPPPRPRRRHHRQHLRRRAILGLGAGRGNNPMFVAEHAAVGVPIMERAARDGGEHPRNAKRLWTGEAVSNDGEFYPLEDVDWNPGPCSRPYPSGFPATGGAVAASPGSPSTATPG